MEEAESLGSGPSLRQLVLYGVLGLAAIVFFWALIGLHREDMSDSPKAATTTLPAASPAPTATTSTVATPTSTVPKADPFTFEVVATPGLRQQGLSGRSEVPPDYGMLFVFPAKDRHSFWMKDMRVPIDIIWLSDTGTGTGTIVGIEEAVSPSTYPMTFMAPVLVRYVLETRAGEAGRRGWGIGTTISLPTGIPVPQ